MWIKSIEMVRGAGATRFAPADSSRSNRVTILVGENGAGKTELLASLARTFADWRVDPAIARLEVIDGSSSKVFDAREHLDLARNITVAQTLSPFSRFPASPQRVSWLDRLLNEELAAETYVCIGLHRTFRHTGNSLGRRLLEQSLYRLSEDPTPMKSLARTLDIVGFYPVLEFGYRLTPSRAISEVMFSGDRLFAELEVLFDAAVAGDWDYSSRRVRDFPKPLVQALRTIGAEKLHELLRTSLQLLEEYRHYSAFTYQAHLDYGMSSEYPKLQALSVLRALGLTTLTHCRLFRRGSEEPVELAEASSGQQQLLCSLFSLASCIQTNSLVLVDEPEISLHPKWQIDYLERLEAVLGAVEGCHVLIATHSPLVVQTAHKLGWEVISLGRHSKQGESDIPPSVALNSVEAALLNDFEAPLEGSVYLSDELFRLVNTAESDSSQQPAVIERLHELRGIYQDKPESQSLELIGKALAVLGQE